MERSLTDNEIHSLLNDHFCNFCGQKIFVGLNEENRLVPYNDEEFTSYHNCAAKERVKGFYRHETLLKNDII